MSSSNRAPRAPLSRKWRGAGTATLFVVLGASAVTGVAAPAHAASGETDPRVQTMAVMQVNPGAPQDDPVTMAVQCQLLRPVSDAHFAANCRNTSLAGWVVYRTEIVCTNGRVYHGPLKTGLLGSYGGWSYAYCPSGERTIVRRVIS